MFLTPSYIVMSQFAYFMRFLRFRRLIYLTINIDILFIFNYVIKHIYGRFTRFSAKSPDS